jgi:hypothetical protein
VSRRRPVGFASLSSLLLSLSRASLPLGLQMSLTQHCDATEVATPTFFPLQFSGSLQSILQCQVQSSPPPSVASYTRVGRIPKLLALRFKLSSAPKHNDAQFAFGLDTMSFLILMSQPAKFPRGEPQIAKKHVSRSTSAPRVVSS